MSAVDGEQALRLFAVQAVDLVLLDYLMPRMDGGAVAQEMKKRKPLVPVIMVSGSSVSEDTLTCVDCFIRKGEGPALLLEKIEHLLAMSQQAIDSTETTRGALPQRKERTGKTLTRRSSRKDSLPIELVIGKPRDKGFSSHRQIHGTRSPNSKLPEAPGYRHCAH